MASVDEEQTTTTAGNGLQSGLQSIDGTNARQSRTGSQTLSATAVPFNSNIHGTVMPTTRAERSSASLYTAILNRVDHIQK